MKILRSIWRICRRLVWETATDNTPGLAAQIAYQLLLALPFVMLFLWHLLGLFGTDPGKLHGMFSVLKGFLPPDPRVQDILDAAVASVVVTGSSGILANVGIIFGIYLGTVFIATIARALSQTQGVHQARNWWSKYIVSFFLLFWFGIVILFCFNAMVFGETLAGIAEVNFQLSVPLQQWVAALNLPFIGLALIWFAMVLYLLAPEKHLTARQALPGAVFFSIGWIVVTKLFQLYVEKYRSLQSDLSGACVDHHVADVDVSHLFVPAAGRQIKFHFASGTPTPVRSLAARFDRARSGHIISNLFGVIRESRGFIAEAFGVDHAACSVTLRSSGACPVLVCCRAGPQWAGLHALTRATKRRGKAEARRIPQGPRSRHGII